MEESSFKKEDTGKKPVQNEPNETQNEGLSTNPSQTEPNRPYSVRFQFYILTVFGFGFGSIRPKADKNIPKPYKPNRTDTKRVAIRVGTIFESFVGLNVDKKTYVWRRYVARRKPVKTNEDLCNDLKEFINQAGMPDGCVPSLKELADHGRLVVEFACIYMITLLGTNVLVILKNFSDEYSELRNKCLAGMSIKIVQSDDRNACSNMSHSCGLVGSDGLENKQMLNYPYHTVTLIRLECMIYICYSRMVAFGLRQDLANIVRRRGYKVIKELLAASQDIKVTDSDVDGSLTEYKACKEELTGLDDNEEESAEDVLLSPEDTITEETSITKDFDDDTSDDVGSNFVADDDDLDVVNANKNIGSQNSTETELTAVGEEPSSQLLAVSDSANGSILTSPLANSTSMPRNITYDDQLASAESANTDTDVEFEHHKELELSQLKEQIEKNKVVFWLNTESFLVYL
ncbi:hypothetical protein CTI12_AA237990 [Artemisia annua]|uniref:Uncharacterized protein n=1 Tax=Artemisia annua TaxID=35608 RepID=A0A2U1M3E0_ARTAN|nr:hypothetical protein CTI12_AA237990 [Artemisia annua]